MELNKLWKVAPLAHEKAVVQGNAYRMTVLTERLIRLEYQQEGRFEDRPTQAVLNRAFPVPAFMVRETETCLEIITTHLHLTYDKQPFSQTGLRIALRGQYSYYTSIWYYGDSASNLMGTARTLDEADGAVPLTPGLLSREGHAVMDDSRSMRLHPEGECIPAGEDHTDLYFFGYGRDYVQCLKDYYRLCGPVPLLPRYALGNWWSRYYRYDEASYRELIGRFEKEEIPFSVAVIDMDWHITDIPSDYGSGWTGYTFNKELFPDPCRFLAWLHEKGMHVTLNDHPADGVRAFEEMYPAMAKAMGVDPQSGKPLTFDAGNPAFFKAIFEHVFHPYEDMGVDFWWIDWQQKGGTTVKGIDPLWTLNHVHYLKNARHGKRPMTFSRFAGHGSHRYPIGFSGDSFITWESLHFQPYFTATASNVGYCWWSHDIGGHMHGIRSDELAQRWVQFGVFSPILRLHASGSDYTRKEPWHYGPEAEENIKRFLRLRHRLIPYLYTMNNRCHEAGEPLMQPMYYQYPNAEEAYQVPNQYYFGSELIVCPITSPADPQACLASVDAWLPEGLYYDFFLGRPYLGGRKIRLCRGKNAMPVFAKAGAILPMDGSERLQNSAPLPGRIGLMVFAGADGDMELFEDNGLVPGDPGYRSLRTAFALRQKEGLRLTIRAPQGDASLLPAGRQYAVHITGIGNTLPDSCLADGKACAFTASFDDHTGRLTVEPNASGEQDIELAWRTAPKLPLPDFREDIKAILLVAQLSVPLKEAITRIIEKPEPAMAMIGELHLLDMPPVLHAAIIEILSSYVC